MHRARRIPITELNQQLTCVLCNGYFIDATTIIECLHSFCRSCIVKYLQANKYCPVCDVQVHKTKPLLNIRADKTLQDIVYKLVPRLFQNEMQRRREYYASHPKARPSGLEQCGEASYQHLLSPDETICIALSYHGSSSTPRYLRCPAAVSVGHLQKLIRAKYDLMDYHRVDILHNQDCLNSSLTLMDIAYIYLWRRKGPLELTFRIYEKVSKIVKPETVLLKEDPVQDEQTNSNDWKEVHLKISENGEMSITEIEESPEIKAPEVVITPKREPPALMLITKVSTVTTTTVTMTVTTTACEPVKTPIVVSTAYLQPSVSNGVIDKCVPIITSKNTGSNTTTVTACNTVVMSSSANDTTTKTIVETVPDVSKIKAEVVEAKPTISTAKSPKHKLDENSELEPPEKIPKQKILNHSLGLQHLSNNHPLKKHSQTKLTENLEVKLPKMTFQKPVALQNKISNNSRPPTPITVQKWPPKSTVPCYVPKTTYSPIINVPKIVPSSSESKTSTAAPTIPTTSISTKMTIKTKPTYPIGYKTLRDPPKTWNPQISRASLNKTIADPKYTDNKNERPAKFFKIRNNMPRYLGNPASGVKPMYQVHVSPEKEKAEKNSEIKRHSIVKIDPKTLKPITEKAPETSSLSTQSDLKINTSSVPIFNPLKLQSSPKHDRKSPKSPHSPKPKSVSPPNKREKLNLSFTPPNPFIPNLTSTTVSPNQFLYPPGHPGLPQYDPRMMAALHSYNFLYRQRMPFPPNPLQGLSLDLNQHMAPLASPKLNLSPKVQQNSRMSPKLKTGQQSPKLKVGLNSGPQSPKLKTGGPSSGPQSPKLKTGGPNLGPQSPKLKKTGKDGSKSEKSLLNAVEKLTQNRCKESTKVKEDEAPKSNVSEERLVEKVELKVEAAKVEIKIDQVKSVTEKKDDEKVVVKNGKEEEKIEKVEEIVPSETEKKIKDENVSNNNSVAMVTAEK